MLRIKFGDREWFFDEDAQLGMGEIVVLREMGVDPNQFATLMERAAGRAAGAPSDTEALALAEAAAQIAFLAEVRQNHEARWRDFIWTISLDDLQAFDIAAVAPPSDTEPANASAGGLGAALAAAKEPVKKTPTARKTTRKSPRAARAT